MKIAIQGHPTRGKEVIQLLESLGGINSLKQTGRCIGCAYYVDIVGIISSFGTCRHCGNRKIYTLEEFEKEFPFKIGDKVITTGTSHPKIITGITDTQWGLRYVISEIKFPDSKEMPHISQISLYKEMKEERNITLTLDKAKEWYKKGGELKEIALQAFTEQELNPLPRNWEEFCKRYPIKKDEAYINSEGKILSFTTKTARRDWNHICPSKQSAEAHLAMIQLEQLRNCWRKGWKPEYHSTSYAIKRSNDEIHVIQVYSVSAFLSFPTREKAEEFLECFKDLIEKAGDLI